MKKIFITGATGFIGSSLANRLAQDHDVYALVRSERNYFHPNIKFIKGDLFDPSSYTKAVKDCDQLFHCAAVISFQKKDYDKSYRVNVEGTKAILSAAQEGGCKKFVHVSACAVLGSSKNKNDVIDEKAHPAIGKDNVYAYTKNLAETEVQKFVAKGMDASIASVTAVYGRGDRKLNTGSIIQSVYNRKMRFIPAGGTSFVAIDDLIDGLILIAEKGKKGERYILCSENLTFFDLFNRIARVLKRPELRARIPELAYIPAVLGATLIEKISTRDDDGINLFTAQIIRDTFRFKYYNARKAKEELGWQPRCSLEDAVLQAFDFYKKEGLIKA